MPSRLTTLIPLAVAAGSLAIAGCGGGSDLPGEDVPLNAAPSESDFPSTDGRTIDQILADAGVADDNVILPAGQVFRTGENRFGFGVFDLSQKPITDADVALYAAPASGGPAEGPYPARVESLETRSAFTAQTTANDPDSAKVVYVADVDFNQNGPWNVVGLVKNGTSYTASRVPSVKVNAYSKIPQVGDPAPSTHTPTVDDVSDVAQIDTRQPPDDMHQDDLADVLGKEPVVLVFATPALCQSRVCGPVVDVAEQVKADHEGEDIAFIHNEVYNDNDPNKGIQPQLLAYGLRTEPWTFVIDKNGKISSEFEGAVSVNELNDAVDKVLG